MKIFLVSKVGFCFWSTSSLNIVKAIYTFHLFSFSVACWKFFQFKENEKEIFKICFTCKSRGRWNRWPWSRQICFFAKKRIRITFSANQTLFGHSELFVHSLFNAIWICFQFELEVLIFVERSLRLMKHFWSFFFRSATIHWVKQLRCNETRPNETRSQQVLTIPI